MSIDWYYKVGDEIIGPVGEPELHKAVAAGTLRPSSRIRLGEHGVWGPASLVGGLFSDVVASKVTDELQEFEDVVPATLAESIPREPEKTIAESTGSHWRLEQWHIVGLATTGLAAVLMTLFVVVWTREPTAEGADNLGPTSASRRPSSTIKAMPLESEIATDGRSRWLNETYKTTLQPLGKREWIELDNESGRIHLRYREVTRASGHIELFCPERNYTIRLLPQRIDIKKNGKWEWVANGRWGAQAHPGERSIDSHNSSETQPSLDDVLYLSDLQETSVDIWRYRPWFGFGKNGTFVDAEDRKPKRIVLAGKESPKGIFALPKNNGRSIVTYDLTGRSYRYFCATVGVADERRYGPHTPLIFEVWGDGERLWQSQPVQRWGEPQECKVPLPNISQLELRVNCPGDASFAMAVWCEPRLTPR